MKQEGSATTWRRLRASRLIEENGSRDPPDGRTLAEDHDLSRVFPGEIAAPLQSGREAVETREPFDIAPLAADHGPASRVAFLLKKWRIQRLGEGGEAWFLMREHFPENR